MTTNVSRETFSLKNDQKNEMNTKSKVITV